MSVNFIAAAVADTGVAAEMLNPLSRQGVIVNLLERLNVDVLNRPPWDNVNAPDGQLRHDGWQLVANYVGTTRCLLFTLGAQIIWKFNNGSDLLRVLQECPPFEFYVCDCDFNYLLCFNHHDYVVGWGSASSWVNNLGINP
jgi:hypothetical protein